MLPSNIYSIDSGRVNKSNRSKVEKLLELLPTPSKGSSLDFRINSVKDAIKLLEQDSAAMAEWADTADLKTCRLTA